MCMSPGSKALRSMSPGSTAIRRLLVAGLVICHSQGVLAASGGSAVGKTDRTDGRRLRHGFVEGEAVVHAGKYHPHFDTTPDYLSIASRAAGVRGNPGQISDNYYLVIGDWGGASKYYETMQRRVSDLMADYVRERKSKNPHSTLLFVLSVGDNFYWTGCTEERVREGWAEAYAPELLAVPWFSVMGNHDYGNADFEAACPDVRPRHECNASNAFHPSCGGTTPYSMERQTYSSNALDANKGGVGGEMRKNYHMPDFTYYYTIPELDFELLALDFNWVGGFPGGLGGNGVGNGANQVLEHCGSFSSLNESLKGIQDASAKLLEERAVTAGHRNVAIISHYPDENQGGTNLRSWYRRLMPEPRRNDSTVFNFYGHEHAQRCNGRDGKQCVNFLTGGGGGCCGWGNSVAGFTAITWESESGDQAVECFVDKDSDEFGEMGSGRRCTMPLWDKNAERVADAAWQEDYRIDVSCNFTLDNPRCPNYSGPIKHAEPVIVM
mmetsp:Transcript_25424/g.45121  ORF Transcript_25424/g.45121 Transcript_25424/m.45121 type:complete len:495 (-) Transcript_25424:80-1564(-)|eukprot:CAMPEP_0115103448 /NCGR_PEP_ID=MMETSP0227-20121206/34609_1 /TAXON_ID=89957 /ORGANISM="Polarella glacialis, Strain CCMP 1383" /LENGTH=494 /DNA_ID=CAMNT_0002499943 /DNA_START=127 /DNA_END=1611 /DNA_ORIENTATION=-